MRFKRILLPALCLAFVGLVATVAVHAQFGLDEAAPAALKGNKDLLATIAKLIKTVLSYLGVLFLVLMLYAGFLYMTAGGDPKKVDTAKKIITGAIMGLVIIATSYAITSFILSAVTGGAPSTSPTSDTATPPPGGGNTTPPPNPGCPTVPALGNVPDSCPCTNGSQCQNSSSICSGTQTNPGVCG